MRDTRITQALALVDDARCLLAELLDEGMDINVSLRERNHIHSARVFANGAIDQLNAVVRRSPDDAA